MSKGGRADGLWETGCDPVLRGAGWRRTGSHPVPPEPNGQPGFGSDPNGVKEHSPVRSAGIKVSKEEHVEPVGGRRTRASSLCRPSLSKPFVGYRQRTPTKRGDKEGRQRTRFAAAILGMAWNGLFGPAEAGTTNGFSPGLRPFVVAPSGGKGHNDRNRPSSGLRPGPSPCWMPACARCRFPIPCGLSDREGWRNRRWRYMKLESG